MKKIILFTLLFLKFFNILFSTNFPDGTNNYDLNISSTLFSLGCGDKVGFGTAGEEYPQDIYILGLFWFAGGVEIRNTPGASQNYVTFATPLQIDKQIALADSTYLVLIDDVNLSGGVNLTSGGKIQQKFGNIILSGPFYLNNNTITFIGDYSDGKIEGNKNMIDFSQGGRIEQTDSSRGLIFSNCFLNGIRTSSIGMPLRDSNLSLTNCVLRLDSDFITDYDVWIADDILVTGTGHTFCVNSELKFFNGARLIMDTGTTFSMGASGFITVEGTASIYFNGCNIDIGDNIGQSSRIESNGLELDNIGCFFSDSIYMSDENNHKNFVTNSDTIVLAGSRIEFDKTITFSVL